KEIPDKLMGADYSSIDQSIEGWREEWDIDTRNYDYLNQQEWYTNVAFSALNGGPADSWIIPDEHNYPEDFLDDAWDFEEGDKDGWGDAHTYCSTSVVDGNLVVTVDGGQRYYFANYWKDLLEPIDMSSGYTTFRIRLKVSEIPEESGGIKIGFGCASDASDFWGTDTWKHSGYVISKNDTWYTFEIMFDSFNSVTNSSNIESIRLQLHTGNSSHIFTPNTASFTISEIQLLKQEYSVFGVENAFYTSLSLSNKITERFLGYNIDAIDYPFIEMKVRSQNTTICDEMKFGIHTLPYGENAVTVSLNDYWTWYRFNLYQLAYQNYQLYYPNNVPTSLLFDKIFLNFTGAIDISAIKIYSIADWEYVPSDNDTVLTTAHLEGSQETILRIDANTTLSYNASIDSSLWEETIHGRWEYNLDFVLENTNTKTTILSLYNATEEYVFDLYIQDNKFYFNDTQVSFEDSSFVLEPYRWYKLSCSAYQYNGSFNWGLIINIADTIANRNFTTNISEDCNVTHMKLSIETTNSIMYLRNIALILNDTVDIGQSFTDETEFIYSTDTDDSDIWIVDSIGECYLTKLYRGYGGTIASSAMYLVLDEGITLRRTNLNVEFLAPEDFYIYLKTECYGRDVHVYINDDQDLEEDGLHEDTTYELDKYVFGSVIDRISFTAVNG
ncbi:MAG: hypothetical protein ACXAAM_09170, partial [Candidatus Heimdallarchaeaceae archaeon]